MFSFLPHSSQKPEESFPSEQYLKQREELRTRDAAKGGLKGGINRYLDDGIRTYSKKDLAVFGKENWPIIKELLRQWEQRGLLRIVKPVDEASDSDVVIEMLNYIDQKSNWPNWPIKQA